MAEKALRCKSHATAPHAPADPSLGTLLPCRRAPAAVHLLLAGEHERHDAVAAGGVVVEAVRAGLPYRQRAPHVAQCGRGAAALHLRKLRYLKSVPLVLAYLCRAMGEVGVRMGAALHAPHVQVQCKYKYSSPLQNLALISDACYISHDGTRTCSCLPLSGPRRSVTVSLYSSSTDALTVNCTSDWRDAMLS